MAAGMVNLDLEKTRVSDLTADLAVGSAVITLPEGVDVTGSIDCAVGQLTIRIPRNSAVSIKLNTALVPVRIRMPINELKIASNSWQVVERLLTLTSVWQLEI